MFRFIENYLTYRRGKAYQAAWQFALAGLAASLAQVYSSHPDGYLYSAAIWDRLLGEECDGEIRAYRLAHSLEICEEAERVMATDVDLRNIVGLTLVVKAFDCAAHGNRVRAERLLSSPLLAKWQFPRPLPSPKAFQKMAEEYFVKHSPNQAVK